MSDENIPDAEKVSTTDDNSEVVDSTDTPQDDAENLPESEEVSGDSTDEPDTFDRAYVEGLRRENAKYRQRAGKADELGERLHVALVAATGRLADPTDLPFDADHLDDADALAAAVDDLLSRKPHLAARKPIGEIGQGATSSADTVDLAAILRGKA